jgi:hypothetical protein
MIQLSYQIKRVGNDEDSLLILTCDQEEVEALKELLDDRGRFGDREEAEALEYLIGNSELDWATDEDKIYHGDLTDAPMLKIEEGLDELNENTRVVGRWAFMEYCLRSFLTDLIDNQRATFIGFCEDSCITTPA